MLLAAALALAEPAALPEGAALTEAVRARDAELFALVFEGCDPDRLRAMITPDFEMYHDRDGVVARNAEAFVADYARDCAAQRAPDAWRSRRALVEGSLNVHPVPHYGAMEEGVHVFYERRGNGPERLAGRARFFHLWTLAPDGWRLARVFSYAHEALNE
ncbi:MAG: nuclear transport factor 2 family protein [Sphingomonadaceae bacterium]|nr:nuclear transport factor 2 family protein [Sphingomonadaceae bacterium]